MDPVSLSKIETHLLASLGSKGKNRNSLACLRNAGFHSAVTYCMTDETDDTYDTDGTEDEARHGRSCGGSYGAESFT